MKTKKAQKKVEEKVARIAKKQAKATKVAPAKATAVEKDEFGFKKGSKSSAAIKMLASGKSCLKDTRKKFNTLSFGILLAQLDKNGFKVVENSKDNLCGIAKK